MTLKPGIAAPDFTAYADDGKKISLKQFKGKKVILYFYPKDDTPGCTKEACDFRDKQSNFVDHKTVVIGVSKDNQQSHTKFKNKYNLNFILISDEEGKICEAYGTWIEKSMYGKKYMGIDRATFLINEKGVIDHIWRKVKVPGHIDEILNIIQPQ
ncbi:MAG: thioredoxin-dependent thiol peroxidase [Alphaproteobacteria bacterium]|nr:thioredoxin-dependent thiol peroxidase [Alphaproteobacteria bacterium]